MIPERVMIITDRRLVDDLPAHLDARLATAGPGTCLVQLREKDLPTSELVVLGREVLRVVRRHETRLVVNGSLEAARELGADGVHVPEVGDVSAARQALGPGAVVGASCHTVVSVSRRAAEGASYCTLGPVWATPSKAGMGAPLGTETLREAAKLAVPVFALGGVDSCKRAHACLATGTHGVAGIRAFLAGNEPLSGFAQSPLVNRSGTL